MHRDSGYTLQPRLFGPENTPFEFVTSPGTVHAPVAPAAIEKCSVNDAEAVRETFIVKVHWLLIPSLARAYVTDSEADEKTGGYGAE